MSSHEYFAGDVTYMLDEHRDKNTDKLLVKALVPVYNVQTAKTIVYSLNRDTV